MEMSRGGKNMADLGKLQIGENGFLESADHHFGSNIGNIEGVFTDFDDTLILKDGTLNEKVVNMLKEFAAAGKKVTIWTGGDPAEAAKKLEKLGDNEDVTFLKGLKLVSKYDFAGATAEIVIDDMAQEALGIMFKIRAKKFIKA